MKHGVNGLSTSQLKFIETASGGHSGHCCDVICQDLSSHTSLSRERVSLVERESYLCIDNTVCDYLPLFNLIFSKTSLIITKGNTKSTTVLLHPPAQPTKNKKIGTMPTEEELAARRRIEEEANKVISSTRQTRKLKQRQLVGEQAEEITSRKDHVEVAKKNWNIKGTEGQSHGAESIQENLAEKAKRAYEENLKKSADKGKVQPLDAGPISPEKTKRFVKPDTDLPTLFGSKASIKQPKDSQVSNGTNYSQGFSKIEKVEQKMVGTATHITTTGIDQAGRRVTKTKIILPEQIGETKAQHQTGKVHDNTRAESGNSLMPSMWDGKYFSLVDIRQRKAEGIDKNIREQYLSPEDFEEVFKMTKEEFSKLPKWKRDNKKRELHLF